MREKSLVKEGSYTNFLYHPYWEMLCIPPLILTHRMCYNFTGELLARQETDYYNILISNWDLTLPYIPFFILPYLFAWIYALFILAYTFFTGTYNNIIFRYFYFSFFILTGLESLIWYFFPASITIRVTPDILANSGWLGSLTTYVYERATVWNVFPSAHISSAYIIMLFSKHFAPPKQRWLFVVLFLLITLSAVFIKNHYLIDLAGGVMIGHFVYHFIFLLAYKRDLLGKISTRTVLGINYLIFAVTAVLYLQLT